MKLQLNESKVPQTPPLFLERCRELGLVHWSLDVNGMAMSDPVGPRPIVRWLCSTAMRDMLIECAEHWATEDVPQMIEVSGVRMYPFQILHHGRRTGYSVLIGFQERVLEVPLLNEQYEGGSLSLASIRHAIGEVCRPWEQLEGEIEQLLTWMHDDQVEGIGSEDMIESYAEQLSSSYETVTALHMLGREMGTIEEPSAYINQTIEMIGATIGYEWVAFLVNREEGDQLLPSELFQFGDREYDTLSLRTAVMELIDQEPVAVADRTAVYPAEGFFEGLDPQVMVHPVQAQGNKYGWIIVGGKQGEDSYVCSHDTKTIDSIAGIFAAFLENTRLYEVQRRTFVGTVRALSGAIDAKDRYTRGHSDRVALLSKQLALEIGYSAEEAERVRLCGILHDVGKIGVPEHVLCKNSRLTDEEFEMIKLHPTIGAEMLKDIPSLQDILPGVLHHHERWDGNGYPAGLAGENIPELGRILALADTFDAMSSNRAYRSAMPRDKVLAEIQRCSGSQFEPRLAEAFLRVDLSDYDAAVKDHAAQDIRSAA
ncbi:MAG: HD-GYP domain-containing protein [Phycisphaerales bacterium]|nr:HD-GYP domain-containing protein [Phycisphaerales bacterium]